MSWSRTYAGDTRRRQVVALQRALGCSRVLAVGWDALVRDLATEHDGDLTGWASEDIEAAVGWDGEAGALGAALRASGLLVEVAGTVRPDRWEEREGSAHERERKRSWRASRRVRKVDGAEVGGGAIADTTGTTTGLSRDTDGTTTGLSPQPSPPVLPASSRSLPTPLSYSPSPLSSPPTASRAASESAQGEREPAPAAPPPPSGPETQSRTARLSLAFVDAWNAVVAGRGQHRAIVEIDAIARARLFDSGLDEAGVRRLLERVAGSRFLLGLGQRRFVPSPRFIADNAAKILAGDYDDDRRRVDAELIAPWLAAWTSVEERTEPSSERTTARDLALTSALETWRASASTASWATPAAARGAALEVRARRNASKAPLTTTLDDLVRRKALLEEVMRAGEDRTKAAAAPSSAPSPAPPAPVELSLQQQIEALRARRQLVPRSFTDADTARLAALEEQLAEQHEPTAIRAVLQREFGALAEGAA
jgi:hypothetical protein